MQLLLYENGNKFALKGSLNTVKRAKQHIDTKLDADE